jgi:hypothetical protein
MTFLRGFVNTVAACQRTSSSIALPRTSVADAFFDTNVVLYLFSTDEANATAIEDIVAAGGCIGVQVLNEFATVARASLATP